ncbi:cell wall-binding repeat-containing protein [Euzebya sp.]|uniref:cell wall-binding repeat-containing protein n=1 Tax=Euzebya sp. TaxID=1971409 RepID=UPI003515C665
MQSALTPPPSTPSRHRRGIAVAAVLAVLAAGTYAATGLGEAAVDCPPGTVPVDAVEPRIVPPDQFDQLPPEYRGPAELLELNGDCKPARLESFAELAARNAQQDARASAPFMQVAEGAQWAAAEQRAAMIREGIAVNGSDGEVSLHGQGPVNFDEEPYDSGQGIVDSTGRIDDFFYDEVNGRLFAAIGTAGVWLSEDLGETWRSVGDALPTNVTSAVSWTPSGGPDGTLVVVTGEHTFGGSAYTGLGVFWSDDLGATWTRAEGPPGGTLGFAIEVDPSNPDVIYAATGRGLWRSADAGRTYADVVLPVGTCEGDYNIETCNYAHFVTDVVVKEPGGVGADTAGGTVVAAVGYRAGTLEDISGEFIHSEGNGVYRSDTGEPGTFERLTGLADAAGGQDRLGRIEYGHAVGPEQDHDYLYAVVEDAVLFNGGPQYVPIPDGVDPTGLLSDTPTYLNGVYVSDDFGATWTQLAEDTEMSTLCTLNQSVFCIPGAIEPGVQSWYNMWIEPDPTRQVGGVPTRLVMGLEEVFQNRLTSVPANTPAVSFQVIGAYYGGVDCLLVVTDCTVSSNLGITTTHPDQHDGIWIPTVGEDGQPDGGVRLLVGHDGGISSQLLGPGDEASQSTWRLDQDDNGLSTILPYALGVANDGTAVAGLQDNGTMLVRPEADLRQFEVLGADGTIGAIDPEDSDYAYASSQGHSLLSVTSDRFATTTSLSPVPSDNILFVPPFAMNPLDTDHVITGGTQVVENLAGREATSSTWTQAIDLGTTDREPLFETDVPPPPRQTSAVTAYGDAAYVGWCAPCHILQTPYPYDSGIATNVGAPDLPEPGTDAGWHVAAAEGLPERYVTDVAVDPYDPSGRTVFATLGGYTRQWVPPGTGADEAEAVGEGHVFVSSDAGATFTDITGNLPDTPVLSLAQRGTQLIVGTELGPFISADLEGSVWAPLGGDAFPSVPVTDVQMKADDPGVAFLALYGRGIMRYDFPPDSPGEVRRLAGDQRVATAVAISADVFASTDTVVLARADDYADALAGTPLAAALGAPMLLTGSAALDPLVAAEIQRLGATRAVLLGGATALAPAIEGQLADVGVTDVQRYGGADRFGTAGLVAAELGDATTAWVVKGNDVDPTRGWPDAMSIGPVAAAQGQPILLIETDRLPAETLDALSAAGIERVRIVGGTAAVPDAIADQLADVVDVGDRVAGPNRFATSVAAAEEGRAVGLSLVSTWLARADDFADALSSGPSVAATGGVLLLTDSRGVEESLESGDYLVEQICSVRLARIAGGTAAISQAVEDEVAGLLGDCPLGVPPVPEQDIQPGDADPDGDDGPPPTDVVAGPFGFEGDAEGWTTGVAGHPLSMWRMAGPGHDSDTSFQVSPYTDLADATLTSPEVEVDGSPVGIEWWQALSLEGGGFDELSVEWSADGDAWTEVASYGETADFPAFTAQQVTFTPEAGTIQVRFRLTSDEICSTGTELVCGRDVLSLEGAFVDRVSVLN